MAIDLCKVINAGAAGIIATNTTIDYSFSSKLPKFWWTFRSLFN